MDTLFINGKIYTLENEKEYVEALGVKDGKIAFIGTNEEAEDIISDKTVDLEGHTMIPGMTDSHMHMYAYCQNQTFIDLSGVKSLNEMIDLMSHKSENAEPGTWIKGVNFDQTKWTEDRMPVRQDLDRISRENPVLIKRCCLHAVVVNTKALELVGIDSNFNADSGGIIEKDNGVPNGILREQCTKIFDRVIPDPFTDKKVRKKYFTEVMRDMVSKGLTGIHTYAAKIWNYNEDVDIYRELQNEGELPIRVTVCMDELSEPENLSKAEINDPYRKVQHGAYKIFSDGSMGSRSAALREPYSDDPGNKGFMILNQEELTEKIYEGYSKGLQPAIHAIGDRALDMTLTAIEETLARTKKQGMSEEEQNLRLPFRIIHAQMTDTRTIERMAKLPVIIDMQPIFLNTDYHWIKERVGEERARSSFAMKSMLNENLILTGGSDSPVETYDPVKGMHMAVNRKDFSGNPEGGFYPEERISSYEALLMYTRNPHYATGQQEVLGTLKVGKFADLVVLDRDILEVPADNIKDVRVLETYVAGEKVY